MITKAKEDVLDAAMSWFFEAQQRMKAGPLTPAEERLRVAIFMFRKTRSVSGQFSLKEALEQIDGERGKDK